MFLVSIWRSRNLGRFRDGEEHELKNIAKPVRIYPWSDDADRQPGISPGDAGELAEGSRQHAHTFIVRVIKEPSEFIDLRPRWRGEYQHIFRGENIGRKRFLGDEKLLTDLGEAISRIVSRDEGAVEENLASTRSPDRSKENANHK